MIRTAPDTVGVSACVQGRNLLIAHLSISRTVRSDDGKLRNVPNVEVGSRDRKYIRAAEADET